MMTTTELISNGCMLGMIMLSVLRLLIPHLCHLVTLLSKHCTNSNLALVPSSPGVPEVTEIGEDFVSLAWLRPDRDGIGGELIGYRVRICLYQYKFLK